MWPDRGMWSTESDRPFGVGPIALSGPIWGATGMIRIKAGVPRRTRPRTRARRPLRRALALGLPTVWGAIAITYKLTCPLAQQNSLGARIVTSAVFFAVGTGLIVQVRRSLLRELRQIRQIAGAAQN